MKSDKYISIIIQGIIDECTRKTNEAIRRIFPRAEIILSTWKGSEILNLDFDKIIFSDDPGGTIADHVAGTLNNVNRQIVSTKAGLCAATRPYILKTRTDILFEDSSFLNYFGKYDEKIHSAYFKNRLLICDFYSRNPRVMPLCFHPSDWLIFGRASDVRKYYENIQVMKAEDARYFENHLKKTNFFTNFIPRFTPEQHIFLSFLRQCEKININFYYDCSKKLIEQTERAFAECFVVLDYQKQLKIKFLKYDPNRYLEKYTLLSHKQWLILYEHYSKKKNNIYLLFF